MSLCNRVDRSKEIHEQVVQNELIEHGMKVIDDASSSRNNMTTSEMDHHDVQRFARDGSMVKCLEISHRLNNGKPITQEEAVFLYEMEQAMEKMMERQDIREQIPLPKDLMVSALDIMELSVEGISWKRIFIRTLLESDVQVVYDMTKDHVIKCRQHDMQKLQEEKIPHTFEGKENMQINICYQKQVCEEQRELALAFMHIFDKARDVLSGKTTDRSVVIYSDDLDLKNIEILRKLGYLVSLNDATCRIIITF